MENILPLSLSKKQSVLDGLILLEVMPVERIKALLKSNLLLLSWGEDYNWDFHKKLIMEQYTNEKDQIKQYLKCYNNNLKAVSVKYGKPKHKWGRSFPFKSLGLSCIRRVIRNSLINGFYYDLDISNAQPQIIRNLCESNNIPCPIIKQYCNDRAKIKKMVAEHYNVSEDTAKELFIRLCFFGSFVGWCIENKIQNQAPLEIITLFERELKDIADKIKKVNPTLYETARKKKEDTGEVKEHKVLGTFFALYNQEYESRIVETILCYLINHTDLMKVEGTNTPAGAYEYDGIKLLKTNVDNYEGGINAVVELLNEKTFELTGFHLDWTCKPFEETYDLDEWINLVSQEEKPNEELINDMALIMSAIDNADCGIVETIIKILPNNFIYSVNKEDGSRGDWYGWNGKRWEKSDAPLCKAIMYDVEKYWKGIMDKWNDIYENAEVDETDINYKLWDKTKLKMTDRIYSLKTANGISNIVSVAKKLLANYTLEFDTNEDLFGCENGVIDIKEECFRPYRFDDFITFSCGYDFRPLSLGFTVKNENNECRQVSEADLLPEDTSAFATLKEIYTQIFPDDDLRNYFFIINSTALSGKAIEKLFIYNGAGRNGKGFHNEFMETVIGTYYVSFSPLVFTENQKNKSSSGANPEIAKLNKKRYGVAKEPSKDNPFNNSVIKDFTGGGYVSARMNYSNNTKVKLTLTGVVECNVKPPFSEAPTNADIERINDILFGSKFVLDETEWDVNTGVVNHIYPLKVEYKEQSWKDAHKNAMLNLLLSHLLFLKNDGKYIVDKYKPESVKQRSLAYLQNSYDIHTIFISLFEKRNPENIDKYKNWKGELVDEDWSLAKIAQAIRKSTEFRELSKIKQKEYSADIIQEFFCKNNFYKSIVYNNTDKHGFFMRNWRLKYVDEEED